MYHLPYFKEHDRSVLLEFMHQNPFAMVIGVGEDGHPVATQLPLLVEEREGTVFLSGHLMRNTDHHKAFVQNGQVLCVFTGAHSYVSATWYANPHQASTWNYLAVHARGTLRFLDDAGLREVMQKTTLLFEAGDQSSTTVFGNLSDEYTARLLPAIAGFEIEVAQLENVFKLSQNRDKESFGRIIAKLESGNESDRLIAEEMRKREESLFPKNGPTT